MGMDQLSIFWVVAAHVFVILGNELDAAVEIGQDSVFVGDFPFIPASE